LVLILVTILALCWGWSGFLLGLSDNWGKLILATFWASFYVALAFVIIRRSLAPDDARYDYRHAVNVGLTYVVEGGAGVGLQARPQHRDQPQRRLGLTIDVSASGLGILSYEPLEPGTVLAVEIHGGGDTVCCRGRVAWSREERGPWTVAGNRGRGRYSDP